MIISERIFEILKERGITQKELSEMTGITASTISDWKTKKTNPSADKIMTICDALQITPYDILLNEECRQDERSGYMLLDKTSEDYVLIDTYQKLDDGAKKRLLAYMQALRKR